MAKFNGGPFSKAKGKLAGVVFQQYEGMMVGKEYQPNVKNPNSDAQVANRAAFKLASQLVALYQFVMIVAAANISRYTRTIRGKLVNVIRRNVDSRNPETPFITLATATTAVNGVHALATIPAPVIAGAQISAATITATLGDVVRYTVVAYDGNNNILGTSQEEYTAAATPQNITVPVTLETPRFYDVMAVAMRAMTDNGAAIYDNIGVGSENGYNLDAERLVAAGDVEVSHVASASIPQSI